MSSALFGLGAEKILSGAIDLTTDDIKASVVDLDDDGVAITNATNATPIVITATAHGITSGQRVLIDGVGGNTAANGVFLATVSDVNTFSLQDLNGNDIAGNSAYTSGGHSLAIDVLEFIDDLTGVVGTSGNLASKTVSLGVFDCANFVIPSVTGDATELLVYWMDTETPSTSPLLAVVTGALTPDGNNVNVTVGPTGAFAIC